MQRVLIVEDDPSTATPARVALRRQGYEVLVVRGGREAVEVAPREMPDLILMDLHMPGMEGDEACLRIKAQAETAHIPVVFVSAGNRPGDRERGLRAGGDGYVIKPYDPEHLMHLLAALLTTRTCVEELGSGRIMPSPVS